MIIANLRGGLGNQLFQYAFARRMSIVNNDDLKLDIYSGYTNDKFKRKYSLNNLNIKEELATHKEIKKIKYPYGIFSKIKRFINFKILKRYNVEFKKENLNLKGNLYLDGYWQSEKYFFDTRNTLLKELTLKNSFSGVAKDIEKQEIECNSVSLHIRRADYILNKQVNNDFGVCDLDYYYKAIKIIKNKVNNPHFFIFSDDINWAKDNLKIDDPIIFVSRANLQDYEELMLMTKCKHNIIANSSFSWWGAWLNNNPNKIVIAPKQWFKNLKINTKDIVPETWIRA